MKFAVRLAAVARARGLQRLAGREGFSPQRAQRKGTEKVFSHGHPARNDRVGASVLSSVPSGVKIQSNTFYSVIPQRSGGICSRSRKGAKKRKGRKVYTGKRTWNIVMRIKAALRSLRFFAPLRESLFAFFITMADPSATLRDDTIRRVIESEA